VDTCKLSAETTGNVTDLLAIRQVSKRPGDVGIVNEYHEKSAERAPIDVSSRWTA
jgi:hypothetical protein